MWLRKKGKNLVRFRSANKIDNYNWRGGGGRQQGEGKIQKNLQNKSKHKNNKCFSWVTAVRVLSLAGSPSPPHLPRMPSNTVLSSGPAVGAAQILICSYSVFLPPVSTAIRTSAFSFFSQSHFFFLNLCVWGLLFPGFKVEFFLPFWFLPSKIDPVVCVSFSQGEICAAFLFFLWWERLSEVVILSADDWVCSFVLFVV